MKGPICGGDEMVHDTRDTLYEYEGEITEIPQVTGKFCPACGEVILNMDEAEHMEKFMTEFQAKVNAGIVDPEFITRVRKKLDLSQREAAELFGRSVNAFARYEAGKVKPPVALVKLFKLLELHPELLAEIRADAEM